MQDLYDRVHGRAAVLLLDAAFHWNARTEPHGERIGTSIRAAVL